MNIYKFIFPAIVSLILTPACKAPIQLSNITIIEHFEQEFDFHEVPEKDRRNFVANMLATDRISLKFNHYLIAGSGRLTDTALFINNEIGTEGIVIFTLSLMPFKEKPKKFDVSGTGHYDILNKRTDEVYFSSTFYFTDCINCDDIGNLIEKDSFTLKLKFTQIAINQFEYFNAEDIKRDSLKGIKYRHTPTEDIEVRIDLVRQEEYGSKCFSINYGTKEKPHKHSVYYRYDNKDTPIGTLSITPPKDIGARIIDLKNMNFLIRKYKNIAP